MITSYQMTLCDSFVFLAIDNIDFAKDTPDGDNMSHFTVLVLYQRLEADDQPPPALDLVEE